MSSSPAVLLLANTFDLDANSRGFNQMQALAAAELSLKSSSLHFDRVFLRLEKLRVGATDKPALMLARGAGGVLELET
jgi:hypothetical protein